MHVTKTVVVEEGSSDSYAMGITYSGSPEIKVGGSNKSFFVIPIEWELLNAQESWFDSVEFSDESPEYGCGRIRFKAKTTAPVNTTFQLRAWSTEYNCEVIQDIKIISLY